jgi:hypothetical protein
MQNNGQNRRQQFSVLGFLRKIFSIAIIVSIADLVFTRGKNIIRSRNAFENLTNSLNQKLSLTTPHIENEEKLCAKTPQFDRSPYNPEHLFLTREEKILDHKERLRNKVLERNEFGNAMHVNIMNHSYKDSLAILNIYPEYRDELLDMTDGNNRTPLHLALEIGAPTEIISQILTTKNIAIPDKDGITPIMLAMRGAVDVDLMREMIKMIPQDEQKLILQQKDNQGRKARDWNKMSKEEMLERFKSFEVDATRDDKYCTSSLFHGDKHSYLATPTFSDKAGDVIKKAGLERGSNYWVAEEYNAIKATKENVKKLKSIATEDTIEAQEARKELSSFWWQSSQKEAPIWQYIGHEMDKIYENFSGISLVDRILQNQKSLAELIEYKKVKVTSAEKLNNEITTTQNNEL